MKILVGLSGGVDSSMVAAILREAGHEIIGVHLTFWSENFCPDGGKPVENKCCSTESLEAARKVAGDLGIPFFVLNFRDEFKKNVVDYFTDEYGRGVTPNPCIRCNETIKFGRLLEKMEELGAEKIATGHYAQILKKNGQHELHRGVDAGKDQSYFLSRLTPEKLTKILFPIGHLTKPEVKKLAEKYGFHKINEKKESQGACFFPEKEPREFLRRNLPIEKIEPGSIRTTGGKIVGQHLGLPLYTIGQRRGVDLGGMSEPHFVVGFDREKNELIVGPDADTFEDEMRVGKLSWLAKPTTEKFESDIQIRYRSQPIRAAVNLAGDIATIRFVEKVRAITPGQTAAFYDGTRLLGSGTILANFEEK